MKMAVDGEKEHRPVRWVRLTERRFAQCRKRVQALTDELSQARARERARIAADLHDRLAQSLALAKMTLAYVRSDPEDRAARLAKIDAYLDDAIEATRSVISELNPPAAYRLGLGPAIRQLAHEVSQHHDLEIVVEDKRTHTRLAESTGVFLFRAVQELLTNAVKHAKASSVRVVLDADDRCIYASVVDDGTGFDVGADRNPARAGTKYGLFSLHKRSGYHGGSVIVRSTPGQGTDVTLTLPFATR